MLCTQRREQAYRAGALQREHANKQPSGCVRLTWWYSADCTPAGSAGVAVGMGVGGGWHRRADCGCACGYCHHLAAVSGPCQAAGVHGLESQAYF